MLTKDKLNNKADEIWKSAIKLRGKFKAYEYQNVVLPVIMLRRIECVLIEMREKTKAELLPVYKEFQIKEDDKKEVKEKKHKGLEKLMKEVELDEYPFWNTTNWTIKKIIDDNVSRIEKNFRDYINGFEHIDLGKGKKKINPIEEIFEKFEFAATIGSMDKNDALEPILKQYANEPFGPNDLTNLEMGYIYEELLRKFSEQSGEEAGVAVISIMGFLKEFVEYINFIKLTFLSITPIPMKIPVKISRFLIIPIFLIKTKQEIFIKIDEEPIWSGLPGQFQPVFTKVLPTTSEFRCETKP